MKFNDMKNNEMKLNVITGNKLQCSKWHAFNVNRLK